MPGSKFALNLLCSVRFAIAHTLSAVIYYKWYNWLFLNKLISKISSDKFRVFFEFYVFDISQSVSLVAGQRIFMPLVGDMI